MRRDDPIRKTLVRVALLMLVFGLFATGALWALFPAVPVLFKLALPVICLMTAANLYALANRPRGDYTRRTVETFNSIYRPLKPLGTQPAESGKPSDASERDRPGASPRD